MFRNVFAFEDEDPAWREVLDQFPNHVPRFSSENGVDGKQATIDFTKRHWNVSTNPDPRYRHLKQAVTTFVEWSQVEKYLLPKIEEYERKFDMSNDQFEERVKEIDSIARKNNRYMHSTENIETPQEQEQKEEEKSWEDVATETDEEQSEYAKSLPLRSRALLRYVQSRLDLDIHREISAESRINSLKYLFFHMKCGIYVMIRDNAVKVFAPFANKDYRNSWSSFLRFDCSEDTNPQVYSREKAQTLRYPEEKYLELTKWWANGNIICNLYANESGEVSTEKEAQIWNDAFLFQLKDMFAELCRTRDVPDCEFFLNKRDYPQLKVNRERGVVEPYGFIFDKDDRDPAQDVDLTRHKYKSYLPVFSFYLSERFADIPMPPTEDWMAATGEIFPDSFTPRIEKDGSFKNPEPKDLFTSNNLKKFSRPWSEKKPIAFFRGSATGGGVTCETNQRLRVAEIDEEWSHLERLNGKNTEANDGHPFLDAKIVGWNMRDKKIASSKMTFIHRNQFSFRGGRDLRVPIYEQSAFKYILYIEGHCAACRYAFMMSLESVILRVESTCVADQMWYFPLLRNGYDHILIKSDYSNLLEVLEWCHTHDEECRRIAMNARRLYDEYISRDGILDYLQCVTLDMAKRWRPFASFLNDPSDALTHIPKARIAPTLDFKQYISDEISKFVQGKRDANPLIKPTDSVPALPVAQKRRFRELYYCVDHGKQNTRERCTYCKEVMDAEQKALTASAAVSSDAAADNGRKVIRKRGVMMKRSSVSEASESAEAMDEDNA